MANNIATFKKYIDLLDEVYKNASVTSMLDGDTTLVQMGANANEIIIPKISMDGLADYDRNGGYVHGDVTLTNETVKFNYDRGRKFTVDAMDNEETAGLAFGKLASEFIRTKVVLLPTQASQAFPRRHLAPCPMVRRCLRHCWWHRTRWMRTKYLRKTDICSSHPLCTT